ncbi:MAG: hypothetical protein ACRC78_05420 [Planktothrix sp.]
MNLPKLWWKNPKIVELVVERQKRICENNDSAKRNWDERLKSYKDMGYDDDDCIRKAGEYFAGYLTQKKGVPANFEWDGNHSREDKNCDCCEILHQAGVINQPGKLRYLGNFYAGKEKVCKELIDHETGETYTDDVEFANYLAAWRCEVCGNEWTDGY